MCVCLCRCAVLQYIYKGPDRASVRAEGEWNRDEIKVYEDMRYFGAAEACWRLFAFDMYTMKPPVKRLPMHFDGQQWRTYQQGGEQAAGEADAPDTQLLQWLQYCQQPVASASLPFCQPPGLNSRTCSSQVILCSRPTRCGGPILGRLRRATAMLAGSPQCRCTTKSSFIFVCCCAILRVARCRRSMQ